MEKLILCFALALIFGGCKGPESEKKAEPKPSVLKAPPSDAGLTPADAGKVPSSDEAAAVLRRFTKSLLADDLDAAKADLYVPPSFAPKQVDVFLRELKAPRNLTTAGLDAVLESEFGPLSERFGDQAEYVASKLGLPVHALYAFGDVSAAALVFWDGSVLRVAAVHRLAKP